MSPRDMSCTVAIVGGGPAGASAALMLASLGVSTVVIDGARRAVPTGEVLKPAVSGRLRATGLWTSLAPALRPLQEIVTRWDGEEITSHALANPYGVSWLIDRPEFDRLLLAECRKQAVPIVTARVTELVRRTCGWHLQCDDATTIDADVLVDATGRAAWAVRRHGHRRRHDDLIAITNTCAATRPAPRLELEATADGWRYTAPTFAGDGIVSVVLGDRDTIGDHPGSRRSATTGIAEWSDPQLVPVGDALLSVDPLSGDGVGFAIVSGQEAAATIAASIGGDATATDRYRRGAARVYAHQLELRRQAYDVAASRWPGEPFWQRRRSNPDRSSVARSQAPASMADELASRIGLIT